MNKAYIFVFGSIFLGAFGQIFMKLGTTKMNLATEGSIISKLFTILFNPVIFSGLAFYGFSAILWIFGISKVPLSQAYPLVALSYVLVFFASVFLFKEPISIQKISGLLVIVIGVILIARS